MARQSGGFSVGLMIFGVAHVSVGGSGISWVRVHFCLCLVHPQREKGWGGPPKLDPCMTESRDEYHVTRSAFAASQPFLVHALRVRPPPPFRSGIPPLES